MMTWRSFTEKLGRSTNQFPGPETNLYFTFRVVGKKVKYKSFTGRESRMTIDKTHRRRSANHIN
jgi:hypothetical protein